MAKVRQAFFGITVAAAIALLPMTPAMAGGGHGFRPHGFGLGRGIVGAAVALATLPLAIAAAVVSGGEPLAAPAAYPAAGYGGPSYGYAPQVSYAGPRPYYAPYPGYYAAPQAYYGPRPYYAAHPNYYGHGYYRGGGNSYPRR
jgi:hypothetical protein